MERKLDVLCVGGLVCDFMIRPVPKDVLEKEISFMETVETNVGGDAANEAIVLAKLGSRVCLSSEIGDDGTARELRAVLDRNGAASGCLAVQSLGANTGVRSFDQVLSVAKTSPDWKE